MSSRAHAYALLSLAAVSCSRTEAPDPIPEESVDAAATDGEPWSFEVGEPALDGAPIGPCALHVEGDCPKAQSTGIGAHRLLIDTSTLPDDVQLTDVDLTSILGHRKSGTQREPVVVVLSPYFGEADAKPVVIPLGVPGARPVKVRENSWGLVDARVIALLCDGSSCWLHGIRGEGDWTAKPIAGGRLPTAPVAEDLWIDERGLWVAGDGIHRFDGVGFRTEIPAGAVKMLSIAGGYHRGELVVVAVGERGRGWVRLRGTWRSLPTGTTEDLRAVYVDAELIRITTASGALRIGTLEGFQSCDVSGIRLRWANGAYGFGDGHGIRISAETGCFLPGPPRDGLVALSAFTCGVARNVWYVTPTRVYGTTWCALN